MKPAWHLLFLLPASLFAAAAVDAPVNPEAMHLARYAEVRERIDALFQHRDSPPVEIAYADNPFLIGVVRPPSSNTPETPVIVTESVEARLQAIVDGLRISGVGLMGGVDFVFINQEPRKVGDIISVTRQGATVFVRVDAISPGQVTFSLEGVSISRRF